MSMVYPRLRGIEPRWCPMTWRSESDFEADLLLRIGPADEAGTDHFYLKVCSPAAIARLAADEPLCGRGLLILNDYDPGAIRRWAEKCCAFAAAPTWAEAAAKLMRWFDWEFDGYRAATRTTEGG